MRRARNDNRVGQFVTVAEAARRSGYSTRWLFEAIRRGRLAAYRPGARCTLICVRSLQTIPSRQGGAGGASGRRAAAGRG